MNYLSYRINLCKLSRKRDKEDKSLSRKIKEAEKKGGHGAADETYQTESYELRRIEEEISILKTRYITHKADKKSLPTPSMNEKDGFWEQNRHTTPGWHLTNKGITELQKLLREDIIFWTSILFGLLGLIIALISVLTPFVEKILKYAFK